MKKQKIKAALDGRLHCENGISVKSDVDLSLSKQSSSFFPAVQLMVTVMSALSVIFMLQSFLNADGGYNITNETVVITAVVITALSALMTTMQQAFFKAIGFVSLLSNAVYILWHIGDSVKGFMYTVYIYSKQASFVTPLFAHEVSDLAQSHLEMFFLTAAFSVTLLISIACIYYINFPVLFFETFPVFELGTFWGWEPYTWTVVCMAGCWIVTLSLNLINHTAKRKNGNNTFAVYLRKKAFFLINENIKKRFFSSASSFVILVTFFVFTATVLFASLTDNYRPESFKELRRDISLGFRDFTMDMSDRIQNGSTEIPGRGKAVGGTNGGKLGLYDSINFRGTTSLRVTLDGPLDRPLYLRGYAGEKYNRNAWTPQKINQSVKETFEADGLNLLDYNYIQYHNGLYPEAVSHEISIRTVNASDDLIYAPYSSDYTGCGNIKEQEFDGIASPKELRKTLKMTSSLPEGSSWDEIINYLIYQTSTGYFGYEYTFYDDYISSELNETYMYVPEELKPLLDGIINDAGTALNDPLIRKHEAICNYFRSHLTYDTAPGVTPKDEDFIGYFLTEQKKGYCTYFASAGVMLMRELGVPARYVEGYVIEPEQYGENGGDILVTDRCAHAWCEIFIPGYGWYPLEFTNSYTEGNNPNLTDKERNIVSDDSSSEAELKNDSSSSRPDSSSKNTSKNDSSSSKADNSSKTDRSRSDKTNSKPPVESDKGSGAGHGGDDHSGGPSGLRNTQAMYISMTGLMIVLTMLAAVVRRKTKLDRLEKDINSKDCNKAVISCYTAFLQYISLLGINSNQNLTDVQLSSRLSGELEKLSPGLSTMFMKLSEPAIIAYMSNMKANPEEAAMSRNILGKAKSDIFSMLSFGKRFAAKWVYGIY